TDEFNRWYWPVSLLRDFCARLDISATGTKAELRHRVSRSLAGHDAAGVVAPPSTERSTSRFNWARERLTLQTIVTDNVSFGPNLRGFLARHIGSRFVCHTEFMAWVRANRGCTLADAVEIWHVMENRKARPDSRRDIARCNNYLQYLRDIRDANPLLTFSQAKRCWDAKKLRPAENGIVCYHKDDLRFCR
ncbi:MAG: DUF6434 domain-containing protein, partial [Pseudomonadota bacterium]